MFIKCFVRLLPLQLLHRTIAQYVRAAGWPAAVYAGLNYIFTCEMPSLMYAG